MKPETIKKILSLPRRVALLAVGGLLLACSAEKPAPEADTSAASSRSSSVVYQAVPIDDFYDAIKHWNDRTGETDVPHYEQHQIVEIAENIMLYQRDSGGWPTNKHPLRQVPEAERAIALQEKSLPDASFDNRNTYPQIEYLAAVYQQTGDPRHRDAALEGLRYTLEKQYANGGWAHSPDRSDDHYFTRITFVDEVMSGVLTFLRRVAAGSPPFDFVDADLRQQAAGAVARGDALVLQLQVVMDGKLTGWAGQYHEETLEPVAGRSYELPGVLAWETVPVVEYLMAIENPSPEVITAIESAVAWLESARLTGFRVERVAADPERFDYHAADYDLVIVEDETAKPIWARFYDLQTNQPFLANRDGNRVYKLEDVLYERRTGYSWYGYWPEKLLATDYPAWRKKHNR